MSSILFLIWLTLLLCLLVSSSSFLASFLVSFLVFDVSEESSVRFIDLTIVASSLIPNRLLSLHAFYIRCEKTSKLERMTT